MGCFCIHGDTSDEYCCTVEWLQVKPDFMAQINKMFMLLESSWKEEDNSSVRKVLVPVGKLIVSS